MSEGRAVRRWFDDAAGALFAALAAGAAMLLLKSAGLPDEIIVGVPIGVVGVVGWVWWAVRRVNRRPAAGVGLTSGEADAIRVRLEDLELLHARLAELEERVDFAERLLARPPEGESARRIEGGR
ncbi:MAG: hypothetical protein ACHQXA_02960 [Gemmatimonadales bacterium]